MSESRRGKQAAGILACAVALVAGWWLLQGERARQGDPADYPTVETTPRSAGQIGWSAEPGLTLAVDRSELPAEGRVSIELRLKDPSPGDGPLKGRILSLDEARDDRVRELVAPVREGDTGAVVQLPVEQLEPGLYLIELRTAEKSHFPLLRYRFEVR